MIKIGQGEHHTQRNYISFSDSDFLSKLGYEKGDEVSEEDASYLVGYYWGSKQTTPRATFIKFAFVDWVDMEVALMGFDDATSMI
jgi:hypothetical protein